MPLSILQVEHQPTAHAVVQHSLLTGRLAHGLLLVGPSGVGKEMFATRLAAMLLCAHPAKVEAPGAAVPGLSSLASPADAAWRDACGRCDDCKLVEAGTHPDLHLIYRELSKQIPDLKDRKGLELYIDVIREFLISPANSKPARGRGKLFVVRDAHLMSTEAQNALLKTLEEPPPNTWIVLLTDQLHRLLETTRSRCQLVRFAPLPGEFVRARLAGLDVNGRKIPADEAAYLAARCEGQMGVALQMAAGDLFGLHQELAGRLAALKPAGAVDLADWLEEQINQLSKERTSRDEATESQAKKEAASQFFSTAALVLSDAIRLARPAGSAGASVLFPAVSRQLAGDGSESRLDRLARGVTALSRADYLIGVRFVNPRLALDEACCTLAELLGG